MKKRGISPLVATVILIAIVIVIAVSLWFWYYEYIGDLRDKSQTQLAQECVQNTEARIESSSCEYNVGTGNYSINLEVSNIGSSRFISVLFNVKSEYSSATREVSKTLEAGSTLDLAVIISEDELDFETPTEVELIPAVSKKGQKKYCEDQAEYTLISC